MNYLAAIFTLIIGLGILFAGIKTYKLGKRIKRWPKTRVNIISIETAPAKSGRRNMKTIKAKYSFNVNGKIYEGNKVNSIELIGAEKGMLQKQAEKEIEAIKNNPGVWYNPENPTESFLVKFKLLFYSLLIPLGFLMAFGALIWFGIQVS